MVVLSATVEESIGNGIDLQPAGFGNNVSVSRNHKFLGCLT